MGADPNGGGVAVAAPLPPPPGELHAGTAGLSVLGRVNTRTGSHPGSAPFLCRSPAPRWLFLRTSYRGLGAGEAAGRLWGLTMLGSVAPLPMSSGRQPRQHVGAVGTLRQRLPLSARTRTGWQVRESGGSVSASDRERGAATEYPGAVPVLCPSAGTALLCGAAAAPLSPRIERSNLGSVPALNLTPAVFQHFIFSVVCNSCPLAPTAVFRASRAGSAVPLLLGHCERCCGEPSPGLTLHPTCLSCSAQAVGPGGRRPCHREQQLAPGSHAGMSPLPWWGQPAQEGLSCMQPGLSGREGREEQTVNLVTRASRHNKQCERRSREIAAHGPRSSPCTGRPWVAAGLVPCLCVIEARPAAGGCPRGAGAGWG